MIFWVLDFYFLTGQVKYWGQTRLNHNSWPEHLIYTYYSIGHRLKLTYFLFAHISCSRLKAHSALTSRSSISEKWKMRTWNLGQLFKTMLNHSTAILCFTGLHIKIFLLAHFLLNAHREVHRPEAKTSEKWDLGQIWDLLDEVVVTGWWLASNL